MNDQHWMQEALSLARQAEVLGEVPVGAVVVVNNKIIGRGYNQPIHSCDPTAHAEIMALRDAAKNTGNYRLVDATLFVTIEPCTMCAGALVHSRIKRLVFGAKEPKAGVVESQSRLLGFNFLNHSIEIESGVCAKECGELLKGFFLKRRQFKKNSDESNKLG